MSEALNIVKASFGGLREVATAPLWQWDYGQILRITGLDLPQAFEVHFSNSRKSGETITQIGTDSQVVIPDMYLTSGADIYCFIFLHDGLTDGETEYVIKIPVRERPEPSDIEPTPEQQDVITEAIAALNTAVTQTGQDVISADASAQAAAQSATDAQTAATQAQGSATSASASASTASTAAATATTKAGEAATSAANAASAKTAAETAETNAQAAQTASESARASAESAAQTATAKASEAAASAASVGEAAQTATAKAAEASASATSASGSATAAATSASTASTKANEASASATAAQTAQTAAEAAQTAAQTAAATFETDATLTVSGKAADAKATGDEISDLKSDLNDLESAEFLVRTITDDDLVVGAWDNAVTNISNPRGNRLTVKEAIKVSAGDRLTFTSSNLQIGVWTKSDSDAQSTNIFQYATASTEKTIVFENDLNVCINIRKANNGSIAVSEYDAVIQFHFQSTGKFASDIDSILNQISETKTLTKDDLYQGYYTISSGKYTSSQTRICNKIIESANAGDVIFYHSPMHYIGIWVLYAGETSENNIVPYTTTKEIQRFVLPKKAVQILFQFKKSTNGNIAINEYNSVVSIVRTKQNNTNAIHDCVKSINHRGFQEVAPENTLHAFKLSAEHGFEYIETDVQFTSDGIPVILHDRSINRTARNADGTALSSTINIDSITYEQAQTYDFGIWKGAEFAETKIPSFEQMVSYCKNLGLKVRIELKDETVTTEKIPVLVNIVKKYGMVENVEWISFNASLLEYISLNYPTFNLGYIVSTISASTVAECETLFTETNKIFVSAKYDNADSAIQLLIDAGIPLDIWTITYPLQITGMNKYVSSVTTNRYKASDVLYGML